MRTLYFLLLMILADLAQAASVKISDLPLATSPSTNTFIEIADMNAASKSGKYLLTNLVNARQVSIGTNTITSDVTAMPLWNSATWPSAGGASLWTNNAGLFRPQGDFQSLLLSRTADSTSTNSLNYVSMFDATIRPNFHHFWAEMDLEPFGTNTGAYGFLFGMEPPDDGIHTITSPSVIVAEFDNRVPANSSSGALYFANGSYSLVGVSDGDHSSGGATIGVLGISDSGATNEIGSVGIASLDGGGAVGTAIGVSGVVMMTSNPGSAIAGYFEANPDFPTTGFPNIESSVVLLDNKTTGIPLITARTNNGTTVFKVANDGSVTSSGTVSSGAGVFTNSATMGSAQINGAVTLLSTNVLATPTNGTNYVINLAGLPVTFNMTTNLNILHTTNGTANFTTWTSMARSVMVINNSGTNFPVTWPATWHSLGSVTNGFTLTNLDYCAIAIEWRDSAGNTSQTNNWIGVAYKSY